MLGTRRRSSLRHPSTEPLPANGDCPSAASLSEWQVFCREEGRKAAIEFTERMRSYIESSGESHQVESQFIREFTISLTEILSNNAGDSSVRRSLSPSGHTAISSQPTTVSKRSKNWWKIFKRGKSLNRRDSSRKSSSLLDNDPGILLDGILTQMNLQTSRETPIWEKVRLVLINRQGNHQLEVYTPPKNTIPKMSLFCFLIEEVRSTSLLEVPDSNSSFVIKSRSHGEYVFNTDSPHDKDMWMSTISQYSTAHIPVSASLNALTESHRSNGRIFPRSRSQTPIVNTCGSLTEISKSYPSALPPPSSHYNSTIDEPVMVDILLLDDEREGRERSSSGSSTSATHKRRVRSMCLETPSPIMPDSSPLPSSDPNSLPPPPPRPPKLTNSPIRIPNTTNNCDTINSITDSGIVATPPSPPPPIPRHRKSSAPPTVINSMSNGEGGVSSLFSSSEAIGSIDPEEGLTFETPPTNGRGHSRHRSYDSSYSHGTDVGGATSPLVRNSYRIDVGSNERISNINSGPSSTFSSAGNLHDVTRDVTHSPSTVPTTPDPLLGLETSSTLSNPLYIETTSHIDIHLPRHTEHPYQSWANTSVDVENLRTLSQYPWFHGMISRNNATQLVLAGGRSGQYLVRQSESREGDFVLTFNCHNRAKHLRLTLDSTGCTIQHLWFEDAPTMIEYFKSHPIPLDAVPATEDITLTAHVDRTASDSFRTTTIINMERINRTPPRRSRSIHVSSSLGTTLDGSGGANSPIHGSRSGRNRWPFNRHQRSSSSQSVRSHATVQRTHSANAGSLQEIGYRNGGGGRWSSRVSENNYVSRNY